MLNFEIDISARCVFLVMDNSRISNHHRMIRYIRIHIAVWRNQNIIPNMNVANHGCVDANKHVTSDMGRTDITTIYPSDGAAFVKIYVIAKHNIRSNSYIVWVTKIQTSANLCLR